MLRGLPFNNLASIASVKLLINTIEYCSAMGATVFEPSKSKLGIYKQSCKALQAVHKVLGLVGGDVARGRGHDDSDCGGGGE